jgi:hypothetical protein
MTSLHDSVVECRNHVESFQVKDKFLDRSFKKDFQDMSIVVQEQANKLYKWVKNFDKTWSRLELSGNAVFICRKDVEGIGVTRFKSNWKSMDRTILS